MSTQGLRATQPSRVLSALQQGPAGLAPAAPPAILGHLNPTGGGQTEGDFMGIYRGFDQAALDREYSPSSRVGNIMPYIRRYSELSAEARNQLYPSQPEKLIKYQPYNCLVWLS